MSIKAKFTCNTVAAHASGDKTVSFTAVSKSDGDKQDYAKYTPSGNLQMMISPETKAADYFQPGKDYYLTFEEAN